MRHFGQSMLLVTVLLVGACTSDDVGDDVSHGTPDSVQSPGDIAVPGETAADGDAIDNLDNGWTGEPTVFDCGASAWQFQSGVLLLSDSSQLQLVQRIDEATLLIAGPLDKVAQPGTVLLATPSEGGVLAKLVSMSAIEDDLWQVKIASAPLSELFVSASIDERSPVDLSSSTFSGTLQGVAELMEEGKADSFGLGTLHVPFSDLEIIAATVQNSLGGEATVYLGVKEGHFYFTPTVLFELDVGFGGVNKLLLALEYKQKLILELELSLSGSLDDWEPDPEPLPFLVFPKAVVVFPWGWLDLGGGFRFAAELSFEGSMEVTGGATIESTTVLGAQYSEGAWSPIQEKDTAVDKIGPEFEAAAEFGAMVGIKGTYTLKPWSVAGPSIYALAYLRLLGEFATDPVRVLWHLLFGIEAGAEFEISPFGIEIEKFSAALFDWSIPIAEGEYEMPCVPACPAGHCAIDDECGGTCQCPGGSDCVDGECLPQDCLPQCGECQACVQGNCIALPDGSPCGTGLHCKTGICEEDQPCQPDCSEKKCGADGCGGPCPNLCKAGQSCDESFQCVDGPCVPNCLEKECGDGGCPDSPNACGKCSSPGQCKTVSCKSGSCVQALQTGVNCDDADVCTDKDTCTNGACKGTPKNCSGLADLCNIGVCKNGQCEKTPVADGQPCGGGQTCTEGTCGDGGCVDFKPDSLSGIPVSPIKKGTKFQATLIIYNVGSKDFVGQADVQVVLSETETVSPNVCTLGFFAMPDIKAAGSASLNMPMEGWATCPIGEYYLVFLVDGVFVVEECDETNNTTTASVTIN